MGYFHKIILYTCLERDRHERYKSSSRNGRATGIGKLALSALEGGYASSHSRKKKEKIRGDRKSWLMSLETKKYWPWQRTFPAVRMWKDLCFYR